MTPRNAPARADCRTVAPVLLALWLPLVAAPVLGAREEGATPATDSRAAAPIEVPKASAKPERTESLAKPPGGTRPDPEQANPGLLNPCHGSPQPKWCGE
ncbi:hypothetical protein ACW73L_08100 [Methylolobus aquaticus]